MQTSDSLGAPAPPEQPADGAGSVRSVERTLDLLTSLELSGQSLRLSDLSRLTGIHRATAQRLLQVLERRGLVQRVHGRYQIGVAAMPLAHAYVAGNSLTRAAYPILQELAHRSGETASLFVRLGWHRVVVHRVEGANPLRYTMPLGERLPLHIGAGRVIAAGMDPAELRQLLDRVGEMRLASGVVVTEEELRQELARIRHQGFYVALAERHLSVGSVSAPVVAPDGSTSAVVVVTGSMDRLSDAWVKTMSVEVREAAQALAAAYARV